MDPRRDLLYARVAMARNGDTPKKLKLYVLEGSHPCAPPWRPRWQLKAIAVRAASNLTLPLTQMLIGPLRLRRARPYRGMRLRRGEASWARARSCAASTS